MALAAWISTLILMIVFIAVVDTVSYVAFNFGVRHAETTIVRRRPPRTRSCRSRSACYSCTSARSACSGPASRS